MEAFFRAKFVLVAILRVIFVSTIFNAYTLPHTQLISVVLGLGLRVCPWFSRKPTSFSSEPTRGFQLKKRVCSLPAVRQFGTDWTASSEYMCHCLQHVHHLRSRSFYDVDPVRECLRTLLVSTSIYDPVASSLSAKLVWAAVKIPRDIQVEGRCCPASPATRSLLEAGDGNFAALSRARSALQGG